MKKTQGNLLIIFLAILCIYAISLITGKYATEPVEAWEATGYGAGMVNAMDSIHLPVQSAAPLGAEDDAFEWEGKAPPGVPTPKFVPYGGGGAFETIAPVGLMGPFMRVTWTGKDNYSGQWLELDNSLFENVGCTGGGLPAYQTYEAKDWSCYEYIRFYYYYNIFAGSQGAPAGTISQTATFYDGASSITSSGTDVPKQNPLADTAFTCHHTVSLRWLANQYNAEAGAYFDVSNILNYSINAPWHAYDDGLIDVNLITDPGYPADAKHMIMYYDYLTLGADVIPSDPPGGVSATQIYQGISPLAEISWTAAAQTGTSPIRGYHIYRALGSGGPYYSNGVTPNASTTSYVDLAGNTLGVTAQYCYKVLAFDNGPTLAVADEKFNTINGSYHEDFLGNATEVCLNLDPLPTFTFTVTETETPDPFTTPGTPTETFTPTQTETPTIDPSRRISDPHIYPNPFNPDKGSKRFYVKNVPVDTKVYIYSMDGSLVEEDTVRAHPDYPYAGEVFIWNGKNKNGSKVVTGLYYLVLEDNETGEKAVHRIIVCYECDPVWDPNN